METNHQEFATNEAFEKALKTWRGAGKQWILYSGMVAGKHVELKTYGHTYCQILRVNGANKHIPPMDCKVSVFNEAIKAALA